MRTLIRSAALLVVALSACGPGGDGDASASEPTDERGALYAVLLDSMRHHASGRSLEHRYVQVEATPRTAEQTRQEFLVREVPEATPDLVAAFQAAARQPVDVRALAGRRGVEWITRDSLEEVIRAASTQRLPDPADFSTMELSPVGISADGRRALVYVRNWCGGRCGDEGWALLERQPDGQWALRRMLITAIY